MPRRVNKDPCFSSPCGSYVLSGFLRVIKRKQNRKFKDYIGIIHIYNGMWNKFLDTFSDIFSVGRIIYIIILLKRIKKYFPKSQ